jgi:hypothetical protein
MIAYLEIIRPRGISNSIDLSRFWSPEHFQVVYGSTQEHLSAAGSQKISCPYCTVETM